MRRLLAFTVVAALALSACGTSADAGYDSDVSIEEIAMLTLPGGERHNDVWGYSDEATSTYLVFFANTRNLSIVDVADPTHPELLSTIALPYTPSSHHDFTVYQNYLYVVTEGNGAFNFETPSGLQIVDFSDPKNPSVTFWQGEFRSAHTIYIDEATATLYASGTDIGGLIIVDISEPLNPSLLGGFAHPYVHEVYVRDGIAYTSEIRNGTMGIYDVRDPANIVFVDSVTTPGKSPHSTWLTQDSQYILTADETLDGGVAVYTNPLNHPSGELTLVSEVNIDGFSVHQIQMRGDYLFATWYSEGVIIVDLSDPNDPVLIAQGDTSDFDSSHQGYAGAWGVWPYDPRGEYLYVSDLERGLIILRINGLTLP